jgi:hypothetical protein
VFGWEVMAEGGRNSWKECRLEAGADDERE